METLVFIGAGGNSSNSAALIEEAFTQMAAITGIIDVRCSPFYETSPVSTIPQPNFINAVYALKTTLTAAELLHALQQIERALGKVEKGKEEPRPIDLDILLFGGEEHEDPELIIPHPRWKERLFVLVPLLDLTEEVALPGGELFNIRKYLESFPNTEYSNLIIALHSGPCRQATAP